MSTFWPGIAMLAGTAAQVVGQVQQAAAAKATAAYNATVARQNALADAQAAEVQAQQLDYAAGFAREDVDLLAQATAFRVSQQRRLAAQRQGQFRVQVGHSGVTMAGSPMQQLIDQTYEDAQTASLLQYQGDLAQLAKRREAAQLGYQATVARTTGQRTLLSGNQAADLALWGGDVAATGKLLGAGGSLATGIGKYYAAKVPAQPADRWTEPDSQ